MNTQNSTQKFWTVWQHCGGGAPNKKHATKDEAVQEAARLAQQSNDRYFVLEVVGVVAPVNSPVDYEDVV